MTLRHLGWTLVVLGTLGIAVALELLTPGPPAGGLAITHAIYTAEGGQPEAVTLPYAVYPSIHRQPQWATYTVEFGDTGEDVALYVPTVNRRIDVSVNGEQISENGRHVFWSGPLSATSELVRVPRGLIKPGANRVDVTLYNRSYIGPTYISEMYIGPESAFATNFSARLFIYNKLVVMALGAHLMLILGLVLGYFLRRRDPIFSWLLSWVAVAVIVSAGNYLGFQPGFERILPFYLACVPLVGVLNTAAALVVMNLRPPRSLIVAMLAVTVVTFTLAAIGNAPARAALALIAIVGLISATAAATGLIAWGAFWKKSTDARLLLGPIALFTWFMIRDAYVAATLPAHGFNLLTAYGRPLFIAGLTLVLMRRMGVSLESVDRANEMLNRTLAAREAELAELHEQERARTMRLVREQERQRLTRDLHDGLSGHLASIIAMSERVGEGVKPIEQAARDALDDLRLVIYSLDLGDRELPVALASFRDRLHPQLHRLGIALDWSIADLPEISGVTPGNALSVLRILQQAIGDAIKHGAAHKIIVRGAAGSDGDVLIRVESDGHSFVDALGVHGFANMRRRAERLNGSLGIETRVGGARMVLRLPPRLPAFEDVDMAPNEPA